MDFRSMKRRELQVLCKKNKIPANLSNLEMASKLTELFQEKEKPSSRGLIKGQADDKSETEFNVVLHRLDKKVRFNPEHEFIEFTRSREKKRRSQRTSALVDNSLSVENVYKAGSKNGKVDCSVRVTLREKLSVNSVSNGNKRCRNNMDDRENEGVDSVGLEKISELFLDGPGRVTRSKGKKLVESLVREKSRGENRIAVGTRRSLRNRGVVDVGRDSSVLVKNNENRREQILEDKVTAEENIFVAHHNLSRRCKKKSKIVDYSAVCKHDIEKHDNDSSTCLRNTTMSRAGEVLEVEVKSNGAKVDVHGKIKADCSVDEPMKMELRSSSRRKFEISLHDESGKHNLTVVNDKYSPNASVLQSETSGVSDNYVKVIQTAGVRTRSRDTNLSQKAVSTSGKLLTDSLIHNSETAQRSKARQEKLKMSCKNPFKNESLEVIDELGEDVIQEKNQGIKRARGHISGERFVKPNSDTRPLTRSKRKTHENEKAVSAGVADNFADQIKLSNNLKKPTSWEDSSQKSLLENGELLRGEVQLSMRDAEEGSNDTNAKKLTSNMRLAKGPASEILDLRTDSSQSEIGISVSKLMDAEVVPLLLGVAEHEIVGRTMSDDNNNKPVLQVFGQSEAFGNEIIAADLEVTEMAKADDIVQSSFPVLHSQKKDISAEENLETFEPIDEANLLAGCLVEGENHTETSNNLDMGQKMGEAGGFGPCGEGPINLIHSMSALEMKESSSDKRRINHESVDMTEGANFLVSNDTHSESDEAGESRSIKDLKPTSDENMEFGVFIQFDGEVSARTNTQDSGMCSEYFTNCTSSTSALEMMEPSPGKLRTCHESDNKTEGANFLVTNDQHSESDQAGESRNIKDLKLTSDENIKYGVSIPFDDERSARTNSQDSEMCSEYFIKDGIFHDPTVEVPASMAANPVGNEQGRSPEVCQIGEGYKTSVHNHAYLDLTEIKEGRCLKDHVMDTDDRSSASAQLDCQSGACIMPQDCVSCSGECSIDAFGGKGTFHDSQDAVSTATPSKCIGSKFTTGSSSLQELNWSRSEHTKFEGSHTTIFAKRQIGEEEAGFSNTSVEKEGNRSGNEINGDEHPLIDHINTGEYKTFNQVFESSNEAKYDPEQLKSPLAEPIATPNTIIGQEALSSGSETAGRTKPVFETDSKAEVSTQLVDENANGAECKKEKDDFADAQILYVPMSMGGATKQVNSENQGEWRFQDIEEIENLNSNISVHEFSNLHEFTNVASSHSRRVDRVTPSGPKEASTHGTEKTNMTMSLTKSTTYWCRGNFNEMNQEMEEVSEWEDHIPTDKSSTSPTTIKQEYDIGSYVGTEGYHLQLLFATPIKSVASCKFVNSVCAKKAERADFSFIECFGTTKENELAKTKSDEKVEVSGNELENYLGLKNLTLANGKDIRIPRINGDNDVEVENTCSYAIVSKTIHDANEEAWTENTDEKMRESNSLTKGNVVDIDKEVENEDVGCKVSNTYYSSTENTSECMKESHTKFEINEEDIGVERVNDFEMENNKSSTVLSEATLDCKEKHWIDHKGECMKKSNSLTEEIEEAIMNEEAIEIESLEYIFSSPVFFEAKYDVNEEQCTKNNGSTTKKYREENMFSLGQPLFDEGATDNESKSTEESIISPVLKNLRAAEESAEMLLDFNLSENHRYGNTVYVKHGSEITRRSGDVPGITDNDIKQGKFVQECHCFTEYHKDNSFSRETSVDTFEKNLNPEVANMGSFNGETNLATHKESPPCILPKASENDKVIEIEDPEMASAKIHFDGYILDINMPSANDGIQKTCEERALRDHCVHNMVTTAEHVPTFWGAKPDMLQNLTTHLFVEENECVNTEKTNMETSNFNMKSNQEVDDEGVPQRFFMSEFHPEEDLKNDNRTVSGSSTYDCSNEISEESHLANTIKECLDSEYSVAVLNDSGANLHNDLDEPQRFTDERVGYYDDKDDKPSIGKENDEPEESILFVEPDEGSAMTLAGQKELNTKDDHCSAAAKKNARTILIHGTPNKLFLTDAMKENAPDTKRSQIGDYTTVRQTKRRALQDLIMK